MRQMGNMANGRVIQGLHGLRLSAFHAGEIRISLAAVAANRKSGIRIPSKPQRISTVQIPNRKYSPLSRSPWQMAVSDLRFRHSPRFLIYGSAIKYPRKALKT
jgi:hypothetical protein